MLISEKTFFGYFKSPCTSEKKLLGANHASYVTTYLQKAIMRRSNLQTKCFETRTPESLRKYRKQKNYCSTLYKKERVTFFNNVKVSNIADNKTFWKNIQPIFSENGRLLTKLHLLG